jgi:acetyl-CoA C-acetyltransferase
MGNCVEHTVKQFKVSGKAQDAYAVRSFKRAQRAWAKKRFEQEIAPVTVRLPKREKVVLKEDEGYQNLNEAKVPTLKPAFVKLAAEPSKGSPVLSRIASYAMRQLTPIDFSIAPAKAIQLALQRAGLRKEVSRCGR